VVVNVGAGFSQVEGASVKANTGPLPEGLMDGDAEGPTQFGVADLNESRNHMRIPAHVEEQAELLKHARLR
jgi:hypothetical protein